MGYFVIDNLSADVLIKSESDYNEENSSSALGIGIGGRYFYPIAPGKIYGGLDFLYNTNSWKEGDDGGGWNAMYLDLKAGYVLPIVENVYVNLGLKYQMGLGDYGGDYYENVPDEYKENEESTFGFNLGLQIFFSNDFFISFLE